MNNRLKVFIVSLFLHLTLTSAGATNQPDSIKLYKLYDAGRELFTHGMFLQALDSFQLSLAMGEKTLEQNNPFFRNMNNALGIVYRNLGDYDHALQHFLITEQLYLAESNPNQAVIARIYNNIGNLYFSKLNYNMALDYYQRAVEVYLTQPKKNLTGIADFQYNMANIYYKLNQYQQVIDISKKYLPYAEPETKLMFLGLSAASYKEMDMPEKAYNAFRKSIDFAEEIYDKTDIRIIFEYITFIHFLISVNDFEHTRVFLKKIENLFAERGADDGIFLALYYKACGLYYRNIPVESTHIDQFRQQKTSHLMQSIEFYKKGLEVLGFDTTQLSEGHRSIVNTRSLTQSLEFLQLIADTYIQNADVTALSMPGNELESIQQALNYYILTSDIIHQARKEIYSDESKIQLGALNETTLHKIVHTAFRAYQLEPDGEWIDQAFIHAERMKASAVFDRLSDQFAKENSLIPDSLELLERNLNVEISSRNEKLFKLNREDPTDSLAIAETESMLFDLKKQRDELNKFLEQQYPDYYELKYAESRVLPGDVQDRLTPDEVLLEFVFNETATIPELYLFCISKDSVEFQRLQLDPAFSGSLENFYHFMAGADYLFTGHEQAQQFCADAYQLYSQLISPCIDRLKNKKVIVVPDGKLYYLPFDALLTEMPDTTGMIQFNRLPYLIRKYAVQYSYSANLLFHFSRHRQKTPNKLLAFAPEYYSDTVKMEHEIFVLTPLPGIQREVEHISSKIRSKTFLGDEATELNFREECEDYDILHLAMHAFINDSLPAFSRLAFSQNNHTSQENDGWLNLSDIYNLNIHARLTVLSACNTGSGNLKRGEGVMSLARGFFYAGCPALVMTLWDVEDAAAASIMYSFYKNLKKGRAVDESLRKAKLHYLENANSRMAHPHYWLGFVSIGNDYPLFISYDLYFFILLFLALAGIAADQFIRLQRKKKRK
ncbi:MAG: CHAT domain-containing protein [Mariniphaga sp.]|nr:CHAT domain-containing protein [Mariniphaga sp.]